MLATRRCLLAVATFTLGGCFGPSQPTPDTRTFDTGPTGEPVVELTGGLLGTGELDPFPASWLLDDQGKVALPPDAFPPTETSMPVGRIAWRTGFSPVQVAVTVLPDVDPAALPGWEQPTPGAGGVRMYDLTDGVAWPVMAELDQHEDDVPALLVRPLQALPDGHRVAVVVTTEAAPRPEPFQQALDGGNNYSAPLQALVAELEPLGVAADDIALAWSFPVDVGDTPLTSALEQRQPPSALTWAEIRDADDGDEVVGGGWRAASGTMTVRSFLVADETLDMADDGTVSPTGTEEAALSVHIPSSVADAPANSVPVLVVGHGIFGSPQGTLDPEDPTFLHRMAEDEGMILVATRWRGIDSGDQFGAIEVASDFGRLPLITDRAVQGQVNTRAMVDWIRDGGLFDDPELLGRSGQVLADPTQLYFHGTSMGAILGGVLLAEGAPFDAATFHVGGSAWSTTLTRSRNWSPFELFMEEGVPDPSQRELLYAVSQLWFDQIEPAGRPVPTMPLLLQVNLGDDSVHNIGSELLARTWGMTQLQPTLTEVWGVEQVPEGSTGPLAFTQLDPGTEPPPVGNLPSPNTGAHDITIRWLETRQQLSAHLDDPAQVIHPCGSEPCGPGNTTDEQGP